MNGVRQSVAGRHAGGLTAARVLWTEYNYTEKFKKPVRGARGNGIRFEKKVTAQLEQNFKGFFTGVPFCYSTEYAARSICIPDGVLVREDEVLVVEVKLRHTMDAWFQLRKLYQPVVEKALGRRPRLLEICHIYDPGVRFPEPVKVYQNLEEFLSSRSEFGCLLWDR